MKQSMIYHSLVYVTQPFTVVIVVKVLTHLYLFVQEEKVVMLLSQTFGLLVFPCLNFLFIYV